MAAPQAAVLPHTKMIDIHCHILPNVDDGSSSMSESLNMLQVAREIGITAIIATPHIKRKHADMQKIHSAYTALNEHSEEFGVTLKLGYECYYGLMLDAKESLKGLCIDKTNILLLEFSRRYFPMQWENDLVDLQCMGIDIIVAHPERCQAIQQDMVIAQRMAEIGCELQVSACDLFSGLLSEERKCAVKLLEQGLVNYIASDAHCADNFKHYAKAIKKYDTFLRPGQLNKLERKSAFPREGSGNNHGKA